MSDIILKLNKVKNQSGSTMVTVIVVIAILTVLGAALIESSMVGFKLIKHEETAELAYNAAESGIEKYFAYLKEFCSDRVNTDVIGYNDNNTIFAKNVTIEVSKNLKKLTHDKYITTDDTKIMYHVTTGGSTDAKVEILPDIKILKCIEIPGDKIGVTIGVTAKANYNKTGDSASNKTIFSKYYVEMFIPPAGFELKAAIYTIGDLMVENINAKVIGDVVAFGTSPKNAKQVEQYYYGGIYAKNRGHLSVNGNAYSRGLIRTGEYYDFNTKPSDDLSSIYIYKDAIANGLHIFGKNDKIVVGRNAYTFDDIELNGENSVIAVNGSYVGLSNSKDAYFHDQTSAIVNSAIVHQAASEDSLRSRVVVNGDVIINGGTFRVHPVTGSTYENDPQIEDASVIGSNDENLPMYKVYQNEGLTGNYHEWLLYNSKSLIYAPKGFANLIQCWAPRAFTVNNEDNDINAWTNTIDSARGKASNTVTNNNPQISGFCHYEIGANDKIYFRDKGEYSVSRLDYINQNNKVGPLAGRKFDLDNTKYNWSTFWAGLTGDMDWTNEPSVDLLNNKLVFLRGELEKLTEIFANREYNWGVSISTIKNSLQPYVSSTSTISTNKFCHIANTINGLGEHDYILNVPVGAGVDPISVSTEISDRVTENPRVTAESYFLIINNDPARDLIVNGNVNGIIYSKGRVVIENGANITGAIIAAGKSSKYSNESSADSDDHLPVIEVKDDGSNNQSNLDTGDYAGVYFKGSGASAIGDPPDATVYFPGLDELDEKFDLEGIDIYSIFKF